MQSVNGAQLLNINFRFALLAPARGTAATNIVPLTSIHASL